MAKMSLQIVESRFLTEVQLAVLKEFGVPVRYNHKWRRKHVVGHTCNFCKEPATHAAHRMPFTKGVRKYHLRPDFLNEPWNLVATCGSHNKRAQWTDERIEAFAAKLRGGGR